MPDGSPSTQKLMPLSRAIGDFVRPGMFLCFASTPSRSNAAILELCRQYREQRPGFVLAATGFHSLAHLLGMLRLGQRYIACFFGDNYPAPRSNLLYRELLAEGYELEHWSLWSYVSALAAGAFGQPYAFTRSLAGTSLGAALAARGKLFELPDPVDPGRSLALVSALVPDITFIHAPVADAHGNVAFSPPSGEGFYGALAARVGAIVTAERIVPTEVLRAVPHLRPLPAHRVLAVCEAPFGAHPQPLHVAAAELRLHEAGYGDDYDAYERWRALAEQPGVPSEIGDVLRAADGARAYRADVGRERLEALREHRAAPARSVRLEAAGLEPSDELVLLAGRAIARRLAAGGFRSVLAGIGQSFAACRLAKLLLAGSGVDFELMIETGLADVEVERADPYLLGRPNIAGAGRLTAVDNTLGALCCGGAASCLGVIGAAEVDVGGNVNSTSIDGELLVGAGGAPDIAACASEVMVLTRADPRRLVQKVQYCTSRGVKVRTIVTEACVLERVDEDQPWFARDIVASRMDGVRALLRDSSFRFTLPIAAALAAAPTQQELSLLATLRLHRPARPREVAAHG